MIETQSFEDLMNASLITDEQQYKQYTLNLLTPLATFGANQDAQFRLTSLRGVLRYWWRALQSETDADEKHAKGLLAKEIEYFGGVADEGRGGRSPLRFCWDKKELGKAKVEMLPHKEKANHRNSQWLLKPNQSVTFFVSVHKSPKVNLEYYHSLLEFVFMVGSMGQRARRGFGAIQWDQHRFETPADYFQCLTTVLDKLNVKGVMKNSQSCLTISNHVKQRPVLKSVWIGKRFEHAKDLLIQYGKASHQRKVGQILGGAGLNSRFASPLWGTVRKFVDGYYPVICEMQPTLDSFAKKYNIESYDEERNAFLKHMEEIL